MSLLDTLFPPIFKPNSVDTQEELEVLFAEYPTLSKEFIVIAAARDRQIERQWYEKYWAKVSSYLDDNFATEFQKEESHNQRAWEFHIAALLSARGVKLLDAPGIWARFSC